MDCDGESVEEASGDAVVDECLDVGLAGNIHCCVGRVAAFEAFPGHARLGDGDGVVLLGVAEHVVASDCAEDREDF